MTHVFEKLVRLPMDVMISSMETMARTMQDIQRRSEEAEQDAQAARAEARVRARAKSEKTSDPAVPTPAPGKTGRTNKTDKTHGARGKPEDKVEKPSDVSTLTRVPRLAMAPLFEMYKVPTSGFASGFKTLSQAFQEIRDDAAAPGGRIADEPPAVDDEVVPLDAAEARLEGAALLDVDPGEPAGETLWQIGRPGRRDYSGSWTASFDYHVGHDVDPLNTPRMPHLLTVPDGPRSDGGTARLNIHFSLVRDHAADELILTYDRWGGEKDRLAVDDIWEAVVRGAGRGRLRRVMLSLPALSAGAHVLVLSTCGETTDREHRLDVLKLLHAEGWHG